MTLRPWWIIGGLIALVAVARRAHASPLRPVAPSVGIGQLAEAIALAEGYGVPGAIPTVANNPGDLKVGGPSIGSGISVFQTPEQGWDALYRQLVAIRDGRSAYYDTSTTLADMGQRWAGDHAWAGNVARTLGVSVETTLAEIL